MTVVGGDPGFIWKPRTRIARPMPETTPRATPPRRAPKYRHARTMRIWITGSTMIPPLRKVVLLKKSDAVVTFFSHRGKRYRIQGEIFHIF
jgi:hypothetical protein